MMSKLPQIHTDYPSLEDGKNFHTISIGKQNFLEVKGILITWSYSSSTPQKCHRKIAGKKPEPPYGLKVYKGYKNVMIRRDFANFLIHHQVAKAFEEYLHDTIVPDEHLYASLARISDIKSIIHNK